MKSGWNPLETWERRASLPASRTFRLPPPGIARPLEDAKQKDPPFDPPPDFQPQLDEKDMLDRSPGPEPLFRITETCPPSCGHGFSGYARTDV